MTWTRLHHLLVLAALVLLALSVTGCAGGSAWGASLAALMSLSMLFAAGCNLSHGMGGDEDAGETITDGGADASDPGWDAGEGHWEACCVEGRIDSCFCEAGWSCNYGWYTDCGGGTCAFAPEECGPDGGVPDAGAPDAGAPDAGGDWEPCCLDGRIDTCFCPAGAECNYGWYTDCGDGVCAFGPDECPDADAGVPDDAGVDAGLDGTWEACCLDGMVDTCFCPAGAICNYGWYNDCGDGTCTDPGSMCPAP